MSLIDHCQTCIDLPARSIDLRMSLIDLHRNCIDRRRTYIDLRRTPIELFRGRTDSLMGAESVPLLLYCLQGVISLSRRRPFACIRFAPYPLNTRGHISA